MVETPDITFVILHKLKTFYPIRDPQTSDIMLSLKSMFFSCPHNYYNNYYSDYACKPQGFQYWASVCFPNIPNFMDR